jgi:hypothetical protein
MADLINLNKARKAKTKQRATAKAVENRIVYGISTTVRKLEKEKQKRDAEKIGHKLLNSESDNKKG